MRRITCLICFVAWCSVTSAADKPNIIIFFADDLDYRYPHGEATPN